MRGRVMTKRKMKCRAMRRRGRRMGRSQGRKDGKGSSVSLQALFNQSSGPSSLTIIEPTTRGRSKCFDFKKASTFIVDYKLSQSE